MVGPILTYLCLALLLAIPESWGYRSIYRDVRSPITPRRPAQATTANTNTNTNPNANPNQKSTPGKSSKTSWVEKATKLLDLGNYEVFVKTMKTLAYSSVEQRDTSSSQSQSQSSVTDVAAELLPMISRAAPKLDAAMISDTLWSMGRLGFQISHPEHLKLAMLLLNRLCAFDVASPRQVTTSFGGLSKLRCKWAQFPAHMKDDISEL
jgi:hypothetical protein